MATYGKHECMYMDSDVTIERCAGDWFYTVYVQLEDEETGDVLGDSQKYETLIRFCPFCGEELD